MFKKLNKPTKIGQKSLKFTQLFTKKTTKNQKQWYWKIVLKEFDSAIWFWFRWSEKLTNAWLLAWVTVCCVTSNATNVFDRKSLCSLSALQPIDLNTFSRNPIPVSNTLQHNYQSKKTLFQYSSSSRKKQRPNRIQNLWIVINSRTSPDIQFKELSLTKT